jgi:hypothetical protein
MPNAQAFDLDLSKHYDFRDWKLEARVAIRDSKDYKIPVLLLQIKNISDHLVGFEERNMMIDFAVHVYDKDGREVALTKVGESLAQMQFRKTHTRVMNSGATLTYELNLKDCFQLLSGERYKVTARRYLSDFPVPRDGQLDDETKVRLIYVDSEAVSFDCP